MIEVMFSPGSLEFVEHSMTTIDNLRARRIAAGATLDDVAEAAGVKPATISRWERGMMQPHQVMFRAWVAALGRVEKSIRKAAETN